MIAIDVQIHGYRHGHQLLASSVKLGKTDQALVDRLSDVAGPMRPGERFEPYLSAYPLPGGAYNVVARTWQDLTIPRAGCVRTVSLLIPAQAWAEAAGLLDFLRLIAPDAPVLQATTIHLDGAPSRALPPTPPFSASELLEALFLEDRRPVAMFGATDPELIALRILTALWPELRARFTLSTFALSPRSIEGRSFDLVFAPRDARSRFSDWPGRRIEADGKTEARHRWTGTIVARVFSDPLPELLNASQRQLLASDESQTAAALRVALLWDELRDKLSRAPVTSLGIVDLANSRLQSDAIEVEQIRPELVHAMQRAVDSLSDADAWDFVSAMARKLPAGPFATITPDLERASEHLAARSPANALQYLESASDAADLDRLIASALRQVSAANLAPALRMASNVILARLIVAEPELSLALLGEPATDRRLADILSHVPAPIFRRASQAILPHIIGNEQADLARLFFPVLGPDALFEQVDRLSVDDFAADDLYEPVIDRARALGVVQQLRNRLLATPSAPAFAFLKQTLEPTAADAQWLLSAAGPSRIKAFEALSELLPTAGATELRSMLAKDDLAPVLIEILSERAPEKLSELLRDRDLSISKFVAIARALLRRPNKSDRTAVAIQALDRCLRERLPDDSVGTLIEFLNAAGGAFDGAWIAQTGLARNIDSATVSRNLTAFNRCAKPARLRIVGAIDSLATFLAQRASLDLDEKAAIQTSELFWDAQSQNYRRLLRASGVLLPKLLRSGRFPVSSLIAVTFPFLYRELRRDNDVPDVVKLIPFVDWDRCKAARQELADAFIASRAWQPSDLGLTACRAGDIGGILRKAGKTRGGDSFLRRVSANVGALPPDCRKRVKAALTRLESNPQYKYDWRD